MNRRDPDKERVKVRWTKHFENVLNPYPVVGKNIEENEKLCDTLDVKQQLFNVIFEKGEVNKDIRKTLIKPVYKKGGKSECHNYRGISLVSLGSKLLSNMIFGPQFYIL